MTEIIGLVGLGAMGLPLGKRILASWRDLVILPHRNRTPAEELAALGARVASTPEEVARDCDLVITSLPDVPHVREVLFGQYGLASSPRDGLLYIDMSTITPSAASEFHARLAECGVDMLDAPVSGGPMRAADGSLTIMVGGSAEVFQRARPILEVLGKNITHVGGPGTGQAVKLVNQLIISSIMVANAEALSLGVKAGVPLETLLQVISTSSGSNYLMQNWLPRTLFSGDLQNGFALDLLMKDLNAALQWAGELGAPAFAGALAQQLYRTIKASEDDVGRLDYSVVARLYEDANGVQLRLPQ
ncbi:MAG: NAD(P)-dependent oxidoreductase [Chloroflexia bacterium]